LAFQMVTFQEILQTKIPNDFLVSCVLHVQVDTLVTTLKTVKVYITKFLFMLFLSFSTPFTTL